MRSFANLANSWFCHSAQVFTGQCFIAVTNEVRKFKSTNIQLSSTVQLLGCYSMFQFYNLQKSLSGKYSLAFDVGVNSFQMLEGTCVAIFSIILCWKTHEMTTLKCGHELRMWPLKIPKVCLYLGHSKTVGKNPNPHQLPSLIIV